ADLLRDAGAVDPGVAAAMASGVRDRLGADHGVATTGVAGPDPQDGKAVGTVWVAVAGPHGAEPLDVSLALPPGDDVRERVRRAAVLGALRHLEAALDREAHRPRPR
ncbi:MAG TPA: CinA family protein, partial [Actinomycetales bacterium]